MSVLDQSEPAVFPSTRHVRLRLDDRPRYRGSVHDDAVARRMGYRAALVPGAFVYGHIGRIAADAWGERWLRGGAMGARFRRPVYKDDLVTLETGPLVQTAGGVRAEVTVRGPDGEVAATGWVGLPGVPPSPLEAARLPIHPLPDPRPPIAVGGMNVGAPLGTQGAVLSREDVAESRAVFDETHPLFVEGGFVHPGCLMRLAMFDTNASFRFPGPVVLVEVDAQHHAAIPSGCRIELSGSVETVFERKGRHYFGTTETLLADGMPVASFRRLQIYATT